MAILGAFAGTATAQIRTDGTLGPALSLAGPNFLIGQALGKLSGNNLFQSFATFNVGSGESATFVTTTPGLANVISRVTGGSASSINGVVRLSSTGATPDFFFINPAGVTFGKGAQVDVPAAFNVSTANYVKFPDGNFYADLNRTSTLSSAAPEAFGFLGATRASIAVRDGAQVTATTGTPAQSIRIVAGDIAIDGGIVATGNGELRAAAVGAEATEVRLAGPMADAHGNLSIANGGFLAAVTDSSLRAGDVLVATGGLVIDGGQATGRFTGITSQSVGNLGGGAGNVTVRATGAARLTNGGLISSESFAGDASGTVSVTADTLVLDRGGVIGTGTYGIGNAAAVSVAAREITIDGAVNDNARTGILSVNRIGTTGNVGVTAEDRLSIVNGGEISADTLGTGQGGDVDVRVGGALTLLGGTIAARTFASGDAGDLRVSSATLAIAGGGRIDAGSTSAGHAGSIDVAAGSIALSSGGAISSNAASTGNAGNVVVTAGDLTIVGDRIHFTGISSQARSSSTGDAGDVKVNVSGALSIAQGGSINTNTFSSGRAGTVEVSADSIAISSRGSIESLTADSGNAGSVKVSARNLTIDGGKGDEFVTGIDSVAAPGSSGNGGDVTVHVSDTLTISNVGSINSDTYSTGNAGKVSIFADRLVMNRGGQISSSTFGAGNGGSIAIDARFVTLDGGDPVVNSRIGSESKFFASGNAGDVTINVSDTLNVVNGSVISSSTYSSGAAGKVEVFADKLSIRTGASIESGANDAGNAGSVRVVARNLTLDGGADAEFTRISTDAFGGSGNAGNVRVDVAETLSILQGGLITSDSFSSGNAGTVTVNARNLAIDGGPTKQLTGISSETDAFGRAGNAGDVTVAVAEKLSLANFGFISSDTFASGNAGRVVVSAGTISIASEASITSSTYGTGIGGSVAVTARDLTIEGGTGRFTGIDSRSTKFSSANAGDVRVDVSGTLTISDGGSISTQTLSSGKAGTVEVNAGTVVMTTGGAISSSTSNAGSAGSVLVNADTISLDSGALISAAAQAGSGGQTGTVTVNARDSITASGGAAITITNDAKVADTSRLTPTLLRVAAPNIAIEDGAQITGASTGTVAASNVDVSFGPQLFVRDGAIATSAASGNGGSISVRGSGTIVLQNGQITTSVTGEKGNGGDITIAAPIVVMQTGFIQANTAAAAASGGDVTIDVGTLLPSGSTLFVGGSTPFVFQPGVFGFNVIQAAAPTGVSGDIRISTPALDITGSIASLPAKFLDAGGLGRSPCAIVGGSSLSSGGRGGTPPRSGGLLWIDAIDGLEPLRSASSEPCPILSPH